jgi:hypothetical protein
MNAETIKYLLNQQRIEFKENWENELNDWFWDDNFCEKLKEMKNIHSLTDYLYGLYLNRGDNTANLLNWWNNEHIYHNLMNQTIEDREEMFENIKERLN